MATCSSLISRCMLSLRPTMFQPIAGISSGSVTFARKPFSAKSTVSGKTNAKSPATKSKGKSEAAAIESNTTLRRPPTAFNLYMKDKLHDRPKDVSQRDFLTQIAKAYKGLKGSEKSKYEKIAAPLRLEYDTEKKRLDDARLKRPVNQFAMYMKDRMASRPKDVKVSEFVKIIAQDYHRLSDQQLSKYATAARDAKAKYFGAKENVKSESSRAPSGYNLFMQEQLLNRSEGDRPQDIMKKVAGEWKGLNSNLKQKYLDLAAEKKAQLVNKNTH